jgi:hypothetical protein
MEQRFNKPRVFLSHSKKDSAFIEKLDADLRKCQIDPWLDTYEIRHGKSWLDSIFENGLPTCDAILVYFTESSLSSSVVKKEMDVGILQKLGDNNVAFLPYVNDAKIRPLLRPDIQALQTLEWNDSNYSSLLPSVVAEIWRSYLERTVASATKDERVKRLEAELELEKTRNQREDFFSPSENAEFEYIWNSYEKMVPITITEIIDTLLTKSYKLVVNLATVIASLANVKGVEYNQNSVGNILIDPAARLLGISSRIDSQHGIIVEGFPEITEELLTYGLIENVAYQQQPFSTSSGGLSRVFSRSGLEEHKVFSQKFYRFRYWLAYHQKLPGSIVMEVAKNA